MNTLQTLTITNFQSHENSQFNLSPGFNVLVGPSDTGKSAVIRALKMLVHNGAATGLVRQGSKKLELKAEFDDGTVETLVRGDRTSEFTLNGELYAKAGVAAPDAIEALWALPTPDNRELCLTSQHDAPFMLAEPASAVAKVLGELTNAAMLMEAVREANRLRLEAANDEKARNREIEEAKSQILTHKGFNTRKKALTTARELIDQLLTEQAAYDRMLSLHSVHSKCVFSLNEQGSSLNNYDAIEQAIGAAESAAERLTALQRLSVRYDETKAADEQAALKMVELSVQLSGVEQEIHTLLKSQGQCPLCGNEIT